MEADTSREEASEKQRKGTGINAVGVVNEFHDDEVDHLPHETDQQDVPRHVGLLAEACEGGGRGRERKKGVSARSACHKGVRKVRIRVNNQWHSSRAKNVVWP